MKKLIALGLVVAVGLGALTIWAGLSAFNFAAEKFTQTYQSPTAQQHLQTLKTEAEQLQKIKVESCWQKAQTLMSVQLWLEKPIQEHIVSLKTACFDSKPASESPETAAQADF